MRHNPIFRALGRKTQGKENHTRYREREIKETAAIVKWEPRKEEWESDQRKPFLVQVFKKAVFDDLVDREFLHYFKNSLSIMCEVWLRRAGIDPMINASKNYHKLQDEFFKVLAHLNRGFEIEVSADWKNGVGKLMALWEHIKAEGAAQWIDHQQERRKGDPASRYELEEEPKQDVADAFWVKLFKKGRRWKENTLQTAQNIDEKQSRFFISSFEIDEQKTFTETKMNLLRKTQEEWLNATLSSKLGLTKDYDFLEETMASSLRMTKVAYAVITEGNAKLWLIKHFFKLSRRDRNYLLGTLTGGQVALERLFGSLIATLILGHDRKFFELQEDDAEELFALFWEQGFELSYEKAEKALCALHQSIINTKEYSIYIDASTLLSGLQVRNSGGSRYKTYPEAITVLEALDAILKRVVEYRLDLAEADFKELHYPVKSEKSYSLLIEKLSVLLKIEMELHKVVEEIFWQVTGTFSDLIKAHRIQQRHRISEEEKEELAKIAKKHHLWGAEKSFLRYAPDRCYIGKELEHFREPGAPRSPASTEIFFEKRTQKTKKNYLTPPLAVRKQLALLCGKYGKLIGDIHDKKRKKTFYDVRMVWNPSKLQITDLEFKPLIKPFTEYAITITQVERRKPREKWE